MTKTIATYGLILAIGAVALEWLSSHYAVRMISTEFYIATLALAFTGLGVWVGLRLTRTTVSPAFEKNTRALDHLGVSDREYEVLALLARGQSNKAIARSLSVSPNTVKTHLAHVYDKLDVSSRTQAIEKARSLRMIP